MAIRLRISSLIVVSVVMLAALIQGGFSFVVRPMRSSAAANNRPKMCFPNKLSRTLYKRQRGNILLGGYDEDKDLTPEESSDGNFDGQGFANYLAPYALALLASIAVTVGFVKFVLLDY